MMMVVLYYYGSRKTTSTILNISEILCLSIQHNYHIRVEYEIIAEQRIR